MIALGMIFYGIGWTVFLLPNDLPSGAVPGIASIVYWGTGLPVQYTYFAINALLLLLSLKILGWKFSMKTVYAVFVQINRYFRQNDENIADSFTDSLFPLTFGCDFLQ